MNGGYQPPQGGGSGGAAASLQTSGAPVVVSGAAPPSNGDVLTATSPTTADWQPSGAGGSPLKIATVTLTGAQLAAINATPVTAIAAQGAGKRINLVAPAQAGTGLLTQATVGTTPYVSYGNLALNLSYGTSSGPLAGTGSSFQYAIGTDFVDDNRDDSSVVGITGVGGTKSQFSNQPLILSAVSSSGRVTASNVSAGNAGVLFAPGDTFVDANNGTFQAHVLTVDGGGGVLTYAVDAQGANQTVGTGQDMTATSGLGTGLKIDITAIQSVSDGDGTLTLTIPYIVVTLQ